MDRYAAIVLTGGSGRRLGGAVKPALPVAGRPMIGWVVDAVRDAGPIVLVGPAEPTVPGVLVVREDPPGGGPVAAVAAGLAVIGTPQEVVLLAGDLPMLDPAGIARLRARLHAGTSDGAVYADETGRPQWLCGTWRAGPLAAALAALVLRRGTPAGAALRELVAGLTIDLVPAPPDEPPPYFDCDTPDDLRCADAWRSRDIGC